MSKHLDKIIDKCLHDVLVESSINVSSDKILGNAQKRISSYLKELVKNGDESVLELMRAMGYGSKLDTKTIRQNRERLFKDFKVTDELTNDVLETVKILQQYVVNNGGIQFNKLKADYPDDYDLIIRMKALLDRRGLTYLYDRSANIPTRSYGIDWKNGENEDDLSFNDITDAEAKTYRGKKTWGLDETRFFMRQRLVDQYLEAKYGMSLEVPDIEFSNGNGKLPDNVLIINFTSAINCPAWNECLVKHACYARAGEKQRPSVYRGNENRSLFWRASENDPKLLTLLMDFIRSYCFNFTQAATHIIEQGLAKGTPDKLASKMSRLPLNDKFYTPDVIEIMKEHKRIDYIRLNENGDFIGQWLVDAWENEATYYKPFGIHVSAYTCRHLNYDGIKNLILNTSFVTGNGNVARHFIALPQDVYDALDETYGGPDNSLIMGQNSVEPNPQPLFDVVNNNGKQQMKPNGKSYYKCPCGRGEGDDEINCYQCSLCYQPKASDNTLYVFVAAHGGSKDNLNGYDLINNHIGVSQNFFSRYQGEPIMAEANNRGAQLLKMAGKRGIQGVANNAIYSVYTHFRNLDNGINESRVIKLSENDLIALIKEEVAKIKGIK